MNDGLALRDSIFDSYNEGLLKSAAAVPVDRGATRPDQITVDKILKNIDAQFISQYLLALEKPKSVLTQYLQEIGGLSDRLQKMQDSEIRKSGNTLLLKKIQSISDTLEKLQAHIDASKHRLKT